MRMIAFLNCLEKQRQLSLLFFLLIPPLAFAETKPIDHLPFEDKAEIQCLNIEASANMILESREGLTSPVRAIFCSLRHSWYVPTENRVTYAQAAAVGTASRVCAKYKMFFPSPQKVIGWDFSNFGFSQYHLSIITNNDVTNMKQVSLETGFFCLPQSGSAEEPVFFKKNDN